MFSPHVLVVVFLPFWLGLEWAAHYQSDIFSLPHPGVSRYFLLHTSLGLVPPPTLTIASDEPGTQNKQNPILLIGGPGVVTCSTEMAAVFERPNGTPRFILPGTRTNIGPFERLRQTFDLRDHEFQYEEIQSRSRDGICITLQDVRVLFSIWRRFPQNRNLQNPYPTYRQNLYWLTYRQLPGPWMNSVRQLVIRQLQNQLQSRSFGELFAGISQPEIRQFANRQSQITSIQWAKPLTRPLRFIYNAQLPAPLPLPIPLPRPSLVRFFNDFALGFPRLARNQGIQLEWINVGTWNTPEPIVWEQHLEALKITRENLRLGSPIALQKWQEQNLDEALAQHLREILISAFASFARSSAEPEERLFRLLSFYYGLLRNATERYNQASIPVGVRNALDAIKRCLDAYMAHHGQARFL
ncbi:MAG: hypothetical protein N3A60_01110 [Thermanaerothrix sp.]|nr:hypothetical protein [Thermanaerothrix sp.]